MSFVNNIDPVALSVGPLEVRWYGVLFALGIGLNYLVLQWAFKREGEKEAKLESVAMWLFFGLLIGARLGHVLFYEWDYYGENLLEILYVWQGGLASHGAIIGLFVSMLLWARAKKVGRADFWKFLDLVSLAMPLTGMFVRLGNFANSEIVGRTWDGPLAVVFSAWGETYGRHPVQLYEALMNLLVFTVVMVLYRRRGLSGVPRGTYVVMVLGLYFVGRFLAEFFKERFVVDVGLALSMGQILSLGGLGLVAGLGVWAWKRD